MIKYIIIVLLSFVYNGESHFDELQLSCRAHAGCEVFEICTRQAISQLKLEMNKLVDEKFNHSKKLVKEKGENISREIQANKEELQHIRFEIQAELEEKMSKKLNEMEEKLLNSLQRFITERSMKERNELSELMETKVQETISKMTRSVKKAQRASDVANQKGINTLKSETEKLITIKFSEISESWKKELRGIKLYFTEAINNATGDMHIKISKTEDKIKKISSRCNESMEEVHTNIKKKLEKLPKENLTLSGIERIIDSKFDMASEEWWKVFDDNITYELEESEAPQNVSYGRKYFWIEKADVAIPFNKGLELCESRGGNISTIYDKAHMDLMTEHFRSLIKRGRMYIDVWLGITVDPRSGNVTYIHSTGNATFIEWAPESQHLGKSFISWTGIYLVVNKEVNDKHQGMVNSSPESIRDGVLCEAKIE